MEELVYNIVGLFTYIYGWVPFSGYLGYYQLNDWHHKWGQRISMKGKH